MRLILVAALLPLAACQSQWEKNRGDAGPQASRSFAASGFTGVDLRGPDDVDVRQGAAFSVTAQGSQKALDALDIHVEGQVLKVGRKAQQGSWFDGDEAVKVTVTMPRLVAARLGGSGDLSADKGEGDFKGNLAGSGDLTIASLSATSTALSVAGSGDVKVAGKTGALSAAIVGSGSIDATGLSATSADISVSGSGGLRGKVSGAATVAIAGSGDVELTGGAKCQTRVAGSGSARCS